MRWNRLVVVTGNTVEKRSHWFDQEKASDTDWYSLCGQAIDRLGNMNQTIVAIFDKHARYVYKIHLFPRLCSKCKKLKIMRELAE